MITHVEKKLILGTAQLGQKYGITNNNRLTNSECHNLISAAIKCGINTFDTARDYGDSEQILGGTLQSKDIKIITKLSSFDTLKGLLNSKQLLLAIDKSLNLSSKHLGRNPLDCVLFHRACQIWDYGSEIFNYLHFHL